MKNIARNLTLVGCFGSSVFAAPFLAIGDNAELFVTADASAAYNDNILLSAPGTELEDTVFIFKPGFDLTFGKDSAVKGNIIGNSTLSAYSDNNNLNNQLLGIGANAAYDNGGSLKLKANASFTELDQPTVDTPSLGKLVERDVTAAGVSGELAFSEKISVGSGFAYTHTDYSEVGYTNVWEYSVPVNVYYELTPKVDVSTGITYTRTDLDQGGANQYDAYYYNVGARGAFTAKLSGSFSVGYNTRSVNVGPDDDGGLGANASLAYAYSDKTQLTLALSRDFSNSAAGGASYENSEITLGAVNALTADWRLNASVTYRMLDYQNAPTRQDDYIEANVGATYVINAHLTTSLGYTYRDNSSDAAGGDFENNVVSLSLSARY